MANTTYKELADYVFDSLKDYDFLQVTEDVAYQIVINYLRPAVVMYENCKLDLSQRDDELQEFDMQLDDNTFVILGNYMSICWLTSNFIMTGQALKARLSTADFHAFFHKLKAHLVTTCLITIGYDVKQFRIFIRFVDC